MPTRLASTFSLPSPDDEDRPSFLTNPRDKQFGQQYANLYWSRLKALQLRVKAQARRRWEERELEGVTTPPKHVHRLLEIENGKLCYVTGTVYVDMPLKPNVLEDLARDHHITAPATRRKYHSTNDEVMLEDESGRVRLVGSKIDNSQGIFVTGTILAALGVETASGDFEVFEYCYPGMAPQPPQAEQKGDGEWVALASGLEMGSASDVADIRAELLLEWLLGEAGEEEDQADAVKVTRLILAGNSLVQPELSTLEEPKKKTYGYDSSRYTSKPTDALDAFLAELAPSIPVDIMSGESDPCEPTMPQQPLHPALLPNAAAFEGFTARTNPFWCDVGGTSFFGTSGQTIDDMFKYLDGEDRLEVARQTLEWSHIAPTCPDTLWCYPFVDRDPFILKQAPHVYFIGNQPSFATRIVSSTVLDEEGEEQVRKVRVVLLPKFCETGEVVLVNTKTLETKVVRMLEHKRKAPQVNSQNKGKARATAPPPSKRAKLAARPHPPKARQSNRPRYGASSSGSSSDSETGSVAGAPAADGDEDADTDDDDEESRRAQMLAALEAHQAAMLGFDLPVASTSKEPAEVGTREVKSVWDMGMDDLEGEEESEDEDEDEDDEDVDERDEGRIASSAAEVVAFVEPGRGGPALDTGSAPLDKKDLRDFKAGKIKNLHHKHSIADEANVRYVGGKAKAKAAAAAKAKAGGAAAAAQTPEQAAADAAEESHLDKLDSHLSALIKPLASGGSASLADLLRDLPIEKSKALKGHTPLPKNAPRTLRRGQNAANLKRAQLRDEAAGNATGSKKGTMGMGREALTLKEKRKAEGTDKRQRGLSGAVGKWGRGQISLSKHEIRKVNGPGGK
ncbi:hypothetical protein JCM11641_002969 [Rhodosporidiobolus odoratus]